MHPKSWTDIRRCIFLWQKKETSRKSIARSSKYIFCSKSRIWLIEFTAARPANIAGRAAFCKLRQKNFGNFLKPLDRIVNVWYSVIKI